MGPLTRISADSYAYASTTSIRLPEAFRKPCGSHAEAFRQQRCMVETNTTINATQLKFKLDSTTSAIQLFRNSSSFQISPDGCIRPDAIHLNVTACQHPHNNFIHIFYSIIIISDIIIFDSFIRSFLHHQNRLQVMAPKLNIDPSPYPCP